MSVTIRVRTGLEANRMLITPSMGELLVTTDTRKMYAGDGTTPGGVAVGSSCNVVADQTEMLALKAMPGDMAFRQDLNHMFCMVGTDPTVLASWIDTDINSKADVGLGNVQDFGISDSVDDNRSDQYASSKAVYVANQRAITAENTAIAHANQVKSDLLGGAPQAALDTILELGAAITDNDSEIAAIVSELALKLDITTFNTFVARTDNPHNVTQAQVGLGNVQNYGTSDSVTSTATNMNASSKAVKTAYDLAQVARNESLDTQKLEGYSLAEVLAQARNGLADDSALQTHLADTANPHNVTKAQVGLGKVENFNVAEILAHEAVTQAATDVSGLIATTKFVQDKLVADKYLKDGDVIDGGTF